MKFLIVVDTQNDFITGNEGHALNPLVAEALEGVPADHFICKPTFGSPLLAEKLKERVRAA